jgi:acyl-CoA thioester hydrolase
VIFFETARGTVHAWQCDHMGHANLRAYGEFFEQAVWQVFHRIGMTPSVLRGDAVRMAGVQQNITYKKELLPGDVVMVRSRLLELAEKKLRMQHEMVHLESDEICAVSEITAVCIDPGTRRPRAFPPEVAAKAKEIL